MSVSILDEHGEVLEESKLRTTPDASNRPFSVMESSRVVLEVGTPSPWVSKSLTRHGHDVIVANPRKVQLIAASIQKTDRSDAETLARLGRADPRLLSPIVHRSTERHADLEVIQASRRSSLRTLFNQPHLRSVNPLVVGLLHAMLTPSSERWSGGLKHVGPDRRHFSSELDC
jgi:hypothetical protein